MTQDGETLALDLEITLELRSLGISREIIRMIQEARKSSGLDVSDRINVKFHSTDNQVRESVTQNMQVIMNEILALAFVEEKLATKPTTQDEDLSLSIWIEKA